MSFFRTGVILLCAVGLQATTCDDLCHTFGDPVGCERMAAGERDCTLPRTMRPNAARASSAAVPSASPRQSTAPANARSEMAARGGVEHFYTRWRRQGSIRTRFAMTVGDDQVAFVGEAVPPLDPYYVRFTSRRFESDHILDNDAECRRTGEERYLCTDSRTHEVLTVTWRRTGKRAFDLQVFRKEQRTLRLSSDGRWVVMEMYANGRLIPSASDRYRIAR